MKKAAFTLAETLATLGVIGIIAMITIPAVITDYRIQTFKTQKQVFSENFADAMNSMTVFEGGINKADTTEAFVEDYLTQYLSIGKICKTSDNGYPNDCGFQTGSVYQTPGASSYVAVPFTSNENFNGSEDLVGALTNNGISFLVAYNQDCKKADSSSETDFVKNAACVNVIYDVNGTSGPNIVGMDVGFLTVFYPKSARTGSPVLYNKELTSATDKSNAETYCSSLKNNGILGLPTAEEQGAMIVNASLLGTGTSIWSLKKMSSSANDSGSSVICVYR